MSSPRAQPTPSPWLIALALGLGTLALFARGAGYGFSNYDDPSFVSNNPHVQAGLGWAGVRWAFGGHGDYWHPLTWLSHQLDWTLYGAHARGHHVTSIAWHALNAVLVFLVGRRLTGALWLSALGAALFAWHPLRVESVVWITERKDVMSGAFFLLTLWAYAAYADARRAGTRASGRYLLVLAAFAAGLMSKPMLVTVPALLLLLDVWPLRRATLQDGWRAWSALLAEKLPLLALSVVTALATIRQQQAIDAFVLDLPFGARLANAVVALPRYLGKVVWPFDLSVCYVHPGDWPALAVAAATLLVLALTVLAVGQLRTRPWLAVGWLWFVGMLVPVLGLLQVGFQSMADRYTYLPVLGLHLALLWTWRELLGSRLRPATTAALAAVVLAGLAARTWDQIGRWRDPGTLFRHALAVDPDNYAAHYFLGITLLGEKKPAEAEQHCRRALALNPAAASAYDALAATLEVQGRPLEAIAAYRTAVTLRPSLVTSQAALGALLLQHRQPAEAAACFTAILARRPDTLAAYHGLAQAEAQQGRSDRALAHCETALQLAPNDIATLNHYGLLLESLDRPADALARYDQALRHQPDHVITLTHSATLLERLGRHDEARARFARAVALQPDNPTLHQGLARAHEALGQNDDAIAQHRATLALAPNFAPAHLRLAFLLLARGEVPTAEEHFARAAAADPANALLQRAWADALGQTGRLAAAIPHYETAVRLRPDDAMLHAILGSVLRLVGRRDEAIAQWETALRLDPALPGVRARLEQARRE